MQIQHHCLPNMNLSFKKRACRCWSKCNGLCARFSLQTKHIPLNHDRLGFYAEIQISFWDSVLRYCILVGRQFCIAIKTKNMDIFNIDYFVKIIRFERGGAIRPVTKGVGAPQTAGVGSEYRVFQVIEYHAEAWCLLPGVPVRGKRTQGLPFGTLRLVMAHLMAEVTLNGRSIGEVRGGGSGGSRSLQGKLLAG